MMIHGIRVATRGAIGGALLLHLGLARADEPAKHGQAPANPKSDQTQIIVKEQQPQITVKRQAPQISVRQEKPQVKVEQAQPEVIVTQPKPEVVVREAKPEIKVEEAGKASVQYTPTQGGGTEATIADLSARELKGRALASPDGKSVGTIRKLVRAKETGSVGAVLAGRTAAENDKVIPVAELSLQGQQVIWQSNIPNERLKQLDDYRPSLYEELSPDVRLSELPQVPDQESTSKVSH